MKNIVVGILAHVDAGKTTLSESILYEAGAIRKLGRVDHKDAFLDNNDIERERGITVFSKQATFSFCNTQICLLDTPGHVDFSTEMERTLKVLDYAVLVIDGVGQLKNHTFTLWKLLKQNKIPTFVFVNKMDMSYQNQEMVIGELNKKLGHGFVDFNEKSIEVFNENIALCDESLMDKYIENSMFQDEETKELSRAIGERKIFPVVFGSALKQQGVKKMLEIIDKYSLTNENDKFGAKVYKISHDEAGARLTHMKITGGELKIKALVYGTNLEGDEYEEKINQIRFYSGEKFTLLNEAKQGMLVTVVGLLNTFAGAGLGFEDNDNSYEIEPVLNYRMILKQGMDALKVYNTIKPIAQEDPSLNISWNESLKEIEVSLMGEIQIEVLKTLIKDRFGFDIEFGAGNIVYKETIANTVVGVGHFEPLRHYAEVHLLIKPGKTGSGIVIASDVSVDKLDKNWQRLILTHIKEKKHKGTLVGGELTDVSITLIAGKTHKKHTEGGDFRRATYRAVRQGLMQAEGVLLEPFYEFVLDIPSVYIGRAMTDLDKMNGKFEAPETIGDRTSISGIAPVSAMLNYTTKLAAYTKGTGRLMTRVWGYDKCVEASKIVSEASYNPEEDLANTPDSVFCGNGAGYTVKWNRVKEFMHITDEYIINEQGDFSRKSQSTEDLYSENYIINDTNNNQNRNEDEYADYAILDKELKEIFEKTYGKIKDVVGDPYNQNIKTNYDIPKKTKSEATYVFKNKSKDVKQYLLVDGYNVIFAWDELNELAKVNIDAARDKLMDILSNYVGVIGCELLLVFDAYKVKGNVGSKQQYHNITVIYTKEAETADAYIEKFAHNNGKKYDVTVATSDGLEQIIIRGAGCKLISSREFEKEINNTMNSLRENHLSISNSGKRYLFDEVEESLKNHLENVRLGTDDTE